MCILLIIATITSHHSNSSQITVLDRPVSRHGRPRRFGCRIRSHDPSLAFSVASPASTCHTDPSSPPTRVTVRTGSWFALVAHSPVPCIHRVCASWGVCTCLLLNITDSYIPSPNWGIHLHTCDAGLSTSISSPEPDQTRPNEKIPRYIGMLLDGPMTATSPLFQKLELRSATLSRY